MRQFEVLTVWGTPSQIIEADYFTVSDAGNACWARFFRQDGNSYRLIAAFLDPGAVTDLSVVPSARSESDSPVQETGSAAELLTQLAEDYLNAEDFLNRVVHEVPYDVEDLESLVVEFPPAPEASEDEQEEERSLPVEDLFALIMEHEDEINHLQLMQRLNSWEWVPATDHLLPAVKCLFTDGFVQRVTLKLAPGMGGGKLSFRRVAPTETGA